MIIIILILIENKMRSTLVGLAALAASTAEAKLGFGACPNGVRIMENLDKEAYQGRWYIVLRDDDKNPMAVSRCAHKEFKLRDDGQLDVHGAGNLILGHESK